MGQGVIFLRQYVRWLHYYKHEKSVIFMILYDLTISIINISSKQQNYKVHQAPRFELGWYMLDFLRSPLGCTGFENLSKQVHIWFRFELQHQQMQTELTKYKKTWLVWLQSADICVIYMCVIVIAVKFVPHSWTSDPRGSGGGQLWSDSVCLWHRGLHEGICYKIMSARVNLLNYFK